MNTGVCLPAPGDSARTGKKSVDATSYVGRIMPSMPSSRVVALAAIALLLPATILVAQPAATRIPVIVDADANNELDDQHALAYVLLNGDTFDVKGVTVNATRGGGDIHAHYEEARRVMALCGVAGIPLHAGANGSFEAIRPRLKEADHDGKAAVDFIIARARSQPAGTPLVLLPIGKLTNVALALVKDPSIAKKVRVVWLGSNYPAPGEYNQDNDPEALRYVLSTEVPFEMVLVRYGTPSGTDAIRVTPEDVKARFAGRGPRAAAPVMGRHGEAFSTFGDYSVNLFAHIEFDRTPPSRALYDVGAAAVLKNPAWASARRQGAPALIGKNWEDRASNPRTIVVWENFDRDAIVADFVRALEHPVVVKP
jgi:purine nucleosidase